MDAPGLDQFMQHSGQAAGAIIFLAQIFAGRLHVEEKRDVKADPLPILDREFDSDMPRNCIDMDWRIGRAADSRTGNDRIFKCLARHDVGRLQVLVHDLDRAPAGFVGDLRALAIGRRNRSATRQRHAERFGERIHGRCGTHGIAMADRWRRGRDRCEEFTVVDFPRSEVLACLPDHGAGARALPVSPAIQHRSARQNNRRCVDRRRRHQSSRCRLVASGGQHHPVERIAVQDFDQTQIGKIAVEAGGRTLGIFENRMHRKFKRNAAGLADAFAHALRQFEMVTVAGRQVVAGLRNADDRLAGGKVQRA